MLVLSKLRELIITPKEVNFVPEAISVLLKERYISVPVNISIPFWNYRYHRKREGKKTYEYVILLGQIK